MNSNPEDVKTKSSKGRVWLLLVIIILGFFIIAYFRTKPQSQYSAPMKTDIQTKVIILGFDGMDSELTQKWLDEGKLPNFARLREQGHFSEFTTSNPAESPVSWSCMCSGLNPGDTNIYDFLRRDYEYRILPSWARQEKAKFLFDFLPIKAPKILNLRDGDMIWEVTTANGVPTTILQAPITFPAEKVPGSRISSGLGVPDAKGTQGTFSFYVDDLNILSKYTKGLAQAGRDTEFGGQTIEVTILPGDIVNDYILGPRNPITGEDIKVEFEVAFNRNDKTATITIGDKNQSVKEGQWSDWWVVEFPVNKLVKIDTIFLTNLIEIPGVDSEGRNSGNFRMYLTPINFDPKLPPVAVDLSFPRSYSKELADELQDYYYTQGWAHDTWVYNEELINSELFFQQVDQVESRLEHICLNEIAKDNWNLFMCVFQGTDRMQHMFFRLLDEEHPRYDPEEAANYGDAILRSYQRADDFTGKVMDEYLDENTILIVVSDHGFNTFRRAVNLNRMLINHGFMKVKPEYEASNQRILEDLFEGDSGQFFSYVDWTQTKAYCLGLGQVYLNLKGREVQGIVEPGADEDNVKREIMEMLLSKTDPEYNGAQVIIDVYDGKKIYHGAHMDQAPDLVVGFNDGYRVSWQTCLGGAPLDELDFNDRLWSGDHCSFDPKTTKGIILCNRKLNTMTPSLFDVAPTIYDIFDIKGPDNLVGKSLGIN